MQNVFCAENVPTSFSTVSDKNLISLLFHGDDKFDDTMWKLLMLTKDLFNGSQRFDEQIW